jgi:hypothetical protein
MKLKLLFALLFITISSIGFSQRFDYDSNSKVFFGLNIGHTWHTSDVQGIKDKFPIGGGFIFGGSFNQNYGNALSFDLRLRYLGGNWYGQDTDTTGAIANNDAIGKIYDTVGYAVQNFKSTQHRLSLELAIHANRLRERSGWDPYIFGGIGFTFSQTKGDLLKDEAGYDYTSDPTGGQIAQDYQTPLDMNADGEPYDETTFEPRILPSVGIGIGYYFNSRFSIGLEHKSTFFSDDYFDGTSVNQDGQPSDMFKNDVYHYTSVYFRWYLKRRNRGVVPDEEEETQVATPVDTEVNAYTDPQTRKQPPIVKFTSPNASPYTVGTPTYTLKADIKNVTSDQYVTFRHEGTVIRNFTFNPNTNNFQSTVQLKPGQNIFKLKGTNDDGSDEDVMVINYRKPTVNTPTPPIVEITDPSANPQTVNQPNYLLKAEIKNIDSKNQLTVVFNGKAVNEYNFTPNGANNFSKQLALNVGVNTFKITVTNKDGSDFDETTIIFRRHVNVNPPIVNYTNPSNSTITVTSPSFNLQGTVKYVDSKSNVDFIQNGTKNNNFSFNSGTSYFNSNVVLQPGQNIFQLVGTNSAGSDQATVVINYRVARPKPPIVSILNPSNNPHTTFNNTKSFKASVLNVSNASQVSMTLNGNNFTSFNFDGGNGTLTTVLPLSLGSNTVSVTGTNSDGTDSKQTTIIFRESRTSQPPIVEYVVPSSNPHQTTNSTQLVRATVQNVTGSDQIDVNLNGNNISNFNFNASTNVVEFTASLVEGVNTVTTTGTNSDGVDSETMTILYRKLEKPVLPVVTYIDPITNPKTVYSSVYNLEVRVKHVDGPADIELKVNGNLTNNFTYSLSSELMNFNVSLVQGANIIEITGTNNFGQDVETTSIIYQQPNPVNPPVVNITNPLSSLYTTTQTTKEIGATVLNVSSAQDIEVTINGNNFNNFSYNDISKHVQLNMNLLEGNNQIVISATNSAGSDNDSKTIIYNKEEVIEPPHVTFTNPPSSGYIVNSPTFEMVAEVTNVESKSGIEVKFNGTTVNDNLYSFDPNTKEVHFTTNLTGGNNLFQVRGTNTAGTHTAASNVLYEEPIEECDDPEITFNAPSTSGVTTNDDYYNISAVVNNVAEQSDITLKVNGITIGSFLFNSTTHILIRKIDLMEGNNVVEIIAETECGHVDETVLINYEIPEAPCQSSEVSTINPGGFAYTTSDAVFNFSAAASNIQNMQQLQLMVNGMPINFNFDLGTHQVSANVNLNVGGNAIVLIATNDCGLAKKSWQITRQECHEPNLSLTTSPQNISAPIPNEILNISGTISDVQSSDITVQLNGSKVNFVYNQTNESFNTSINLIEGANNITISATNNCGTRSKEFKVTYEPIVVQTPPTVVIVTPSANPFTTSSANENIVANTTNISTNNQISITVNNANVSFNFDASTETISFNHSLVAGNNEVVIHVSNSDGNASDKTMIIYNEPVVVQPPVVTFFTPSSSPETVPEASFTFSGEVTNLTSENQLQLVVNGQAFSGQNTTIQNGNLQFNFAVPVNASNSSYNVTATGTNSAGTDQAIASIILEEPEEDEDNCLPSVGATFSSDHHSVTATSTKDLSNVVLKYSDQQTQKFDNLTGNSITLSGTGSNNGKCIIGVWIKSGCNQSSDGPGYGEWVPNTDYNNECEITPCDPPVLNLISNVDVSNAQYGLQVFLDNVTSNQVSITHNGTVVNCSYTGNNQIFTCNVTLTSGINTFQVVADGCETVTQNYTVNYSVHCDPVTFNRTFPAQQNETVTDDIIDLTLIAQNHTSANVTVNGNAYSNFNAIGNQIILINVSLNEGVNSVVVSLINNCSQENVNYNITYNAPQSCGPRFNPGNSSWQFCLVTPSGTYNRDDLASNPNFTYTGPASSVYFKPIAGGGDVIVGGNPYPVQNGQYYLFQGNLTVSVSSNHPGSMGHWQICIEAPTPPQFGNGGNRPASPCETKSSNPPKENPREIKKPIEKVDPKEEKKPIQKERPTRTVDPKEEKKPIQKERPTRTVDPKEKKEPIQKEQPTRTVDPKEKKESIQKEQPIRTRPTRNTPEEMKEEIEETEPPTERPARQRPTRTGGGR